MTDYPRVPNSFLLGGDHRTRVHNRLQVKACRAVLYRLEKTGWMGRQHVFSFPNGQQKAYDARLFSLAEAVEIAGISQHDRLVDEKTGLALPK